MLRHPFDVAQQAVFTRFRETLDRGLVILEEELLKEGTAATKKISGDAAFDLYETYGFPLDPKVYFVSHLPVQVRPTEFLLTGAIAIGICMVATLLPSLYAARLVPAEGDREQCFS